MKDDIDGRLPPTNPSSLEKETAALPPYSLAQIEKPVQPALALTLIRRTAEALAEASHFGLVHKNLRPETILIEPDKQPIVLNFNAPFLDYQGEEGEMTYASPEQKEGKALDSRSNIYTLGIILSELLYGLPPNETPAPNPESGTAEDGQPQLSTRTLELIAKCRKEPAWARYQNYAALISAVDEALTAETTTADSPTVPTPAPDHSAFENATRPRFLTNTPLLNNRWFPVAATLIFLAVLGLAMVYAWNRTETSATIPIFDQIPLLMGGENSPARQTAVSEGATATIRALQIRLPTRTPTPLPTAEETRLETPEEPPIAAGLPTVTPSPPPPTPTLTPAATSTNPPPPPPPTETPTVTATPPPPPTPSPTNTPPPPPPPPPPSSPTPVPTNIPTSVPTSVPTNTPEPTEPLPTPTPPILPTSTPPPTNTPSP